MYSEKEKKSAVKEREMCRIAFTSKVLWVVSAVWKKERMTGANGVKRRVEEWGLDTTGVGYRNVWSEKSY